MIAGQVEPSASRISLSPRSWKTRPQPASNAAAASDTTRANIAASHPTGGAVANSNTRTIREQVAAATAITERMTVGAVIPAPEPKANNAVPITRKPRCVAMPKRPHLRRRMNRPTVRALPAELAAQRGPFWMPIWSGPLGADGFRW